MKKLTLSAALLLAAFAGHAAAVVIVDHPVADPAGDADLGVYSVQADPHWTADPDAAKAYDNFSLASGFIIDAINWHGIYAEPIPSPGANVDFLVEIWGNTGATAPGPLPGGGAPDVGAGPMHSFLLLHGPATDVPGTTGNVTRSVPDNGPHVSPSTPSTPGGGPAVQYDAALPATLLPAGDYWLSIQSVQQFDSVDVIDPEWQWHLAETGDGFYSADLILEEDLGLQGKFVDEPKDLAFQLSGQVPEPSSAVMVVLGMVSFGLIRRRRSA